MNMSLLDVSRGQTTIVLPGDPALQAKNLGQTSGSSVTKVELLAGEERE